MRQYVKALLTVIAYFSVLYMAVQALAGDTAQFFLSMPFGLAGTAWIFRRELGR